MSFWDLSDGGTARDTEAEYEIPSGNLDPIPDGSTVLAMIDEAKWDTKDDAQFISLRWSVLSPDEYKNRKVFHKLWVTDDDPNAKDASAAAKKRDKARRMLAAIDANAGGKLTKKEGAPTDESLTACLANKPMTVKVMEWSMPDREQMGEFIRGNWISAVGPRNKGIDVKPPKPPAASAGRSSMPRGGAPMAGAIDDDEIPFAPQVL
jgi:hypothetical protein